MDYYREDHLLKTLEEMCKFGGKTPQDEFESYVARNVSNHKARLEVRLTNEQKDLIARALDLMPTYKSTFVRYLLVSGAIAILNEHKRQEPH